MNLAGSSRSEASTTVDIGLNTSSTSSDCVSTSNSTEPRSVAGSPPPPPLPPPQQAPQPQSVVMAQAPSTTVDYGPIPPHDSPDSKDNIEELCPVCGDKVSGYHYGLLTCESCKGFFKRTVQNKKVYTCVADRNCHIDKSQRKRCPFCRFQKCLDVGMKLEAVRADRMRGGRNKFGPMYKRDRARKLQAIRQQQLTNHRPGSANACHMIPGQNDGMYTVYQPQSTSPIVSSAGSGTRLYDPSAPHIKQELIQIPQLSSSTSSPDSSPSPLTTLGTHHHLNNQQPITVVAAGDSKQTAWPPPQTHTSSHDPKYHFDIMRAHGAQTGLKFCSTQPSRFRSGLTPLHQQDDYDDDNDSDVLVSSLSLLFLGALPLVGGAHGGPVDDRIPAIIREFQISSVDDKEWQNQLFSLLQNQTYNQCEVDLFELMCKVIDQGLFAQVDWARNSLFFKELKVDDQMKLLQNAWSDILMLDHIHQRLHSNLPDETTLPNGQKFDLLALALLGVPSMADQLNKLAMKLQDLKFDEIDFICLKFFLLLNQDTRGLNNIKLILEAQEHVQRAHIDYCTNRHPQATERYSQLMTLMQELHMLSSRGEEFLYFKHINGNAPTQTLLMEMLHAKRK